MYDIGTLNYIIISFVYNSITGRCIAKTHEKETASIVVRLKNNTILQLHIQRMRCVQYKEIIPYIYISTLQLIRIGDDHLFRRTYMYIVSTGGRVLTVGSKRQPVKLSHRIYPVRFTFQRICMFYSLFFPRVLSILLFNLTNDVFSGNTSRIPSNVIRK